MIGFKNVWLNIFAIAILVFATAMLYLILDKEKLTLTLGVTIFISVFGLILAWINRDKADVKKQIEDKVPKKEFETAVNALVKRIDDHREDDKQKYEALTDMVKENNAMTKDILLAINQKKK